MVTIYPAIDLYRGRVVRLTRGEFDKETVYSEHPDQQALAWEDQGAEWIHVVDLEGAKTGEIKNRASVAAIRKKVKCKIQFGGGLRSLENIESILAEGVDRVVLGTKALDEEFFSKALGQFKDRIAVGLDARNGKVQTQGWLTESGETLESILKRFRDYPLQTIIYTDIQRDGMLGSPNFEGLKDVLQMTQARVILSGGVGALRDIEACTEIKESNFEGVIIGKALYDKRFVLSEALGLCQSAKEKQL